MIWPQETQKHESQRHFPFLKRDYSCGFNVTPVKDFYLDSSTMNLSPVQVKFSMYPPVLQLMRSQDGLHTARKFGRRRPMEYLAMSVRDWLAAAPNT